MYITPELFTGMSDVHFFPPRNPRDTNAAALASKLGKRKRGADGLDALSSTNPVNSDLQVGLAPFPTLHTAATLATYTLPPSLDRPIFRSRAVRRRTIPSSLPNSNSTTAISVATSNNNTSSISSSVATSKPPPSNPLASSPLFQVPKQAELAPNATTPQLNLTPCGVCRKPPRRRQELAAYAWCAVCTQRVCSVCARTCESCPERRRRRTADGHTQRNGGGGGGGAGNHDDQEEETNRYESERDQKAEDVVCSRCCVEEGEDGTVCCRVCLLERQGSGGNQSSSNDNSGNRNSTAVGNEGGHHDDNDNRECEMGE